MPQVTLNHNGRGDVCLWECNFGSFVQVTVPPKNSESFLGKICLWTICNELIPLDAPMSALTIRVESDERSVLVRYLTEGEVLTIKF